jgi:hypothetical protein
MLQSKSDEKDEDHAQKLNQFIQNPQMEVDAPPRPGGAGAAGGQNVEDILASMLGCVVVCMVVCVVWGERGCGRQCAPDGGAGRRGGAGDDVCWPGWRTELVSC